MIIFLQLINNFLGENFENVLDGAVVYWEFYWGLRKFFKKKFSHPRVIIKIFSKHPIF
jgi:hypothetical protein